MGVFNKRNAALGWLTWMVGKRVIKRKVAGTAGPSRKKAAVLAAGAVGALTFWKKRRDTPDDELPG